MRAFRWLLALSLTACSGSITQDDGGSDGGTRSDGGAVGDAATTPNPDAGNLPPGYPNLDLPPIGATSLRLLSPTVLELGRVTTKQPDPAPVTDWDFVDASGNPSTLPPASDFVVHAGASTIAVDQVGFKRRPIYSPLKTYDLRVGNWIYLVLASPIPDGASISVDDTSGQLWSGTTPYTGVADPMRYGPAIHVNQTGYTTALSKHAYVGYYLGSLGELDVPAQQFSLVSTATGQEVFSGPLVARLDQGFAFQPAQYQKVMEADFSAFQTPGEYQVRIAGMGASYPFWIDDGIALAFARTYAQGIYNQRCGMAKQLPYTRFVDGADHTAPASVPTGDATYDTAASLLASNARVPQGQTAPELTNFTNGLYPYVDSGMIDVSGGHHDAGDYSKYLMDSSFLVHTLVFAADNFPGVGELDNLGIPESGDGKSDVLQEAKWEADFIARMADGDHLFFYLVYPQNRAYENNVLPSEGDPQIVWPKNTYASAAAVAALADIASSPRFAQQFPQDAARYLQIAEDGWTALQGAINQYGREGSYQYIYFDDDFLADDMLDWAAAALYAATGDAQYQQALVTWLPDPTDRADYQWGWIGMWRGFGCAARDYAFAARSGRLPSSAVDAGYQAKCDAEITSVGDDLVTWAAHSAYATSFPDASKAIDQAGWYFSGTQAFDLAVAYQVAQKPEYVDAIVTNIDYEGGANPVNVSFLSGLGWQRPREMVSQFFQNDRHRLPPTGIDFGNLITGYMYLDPYDRELEELTFPSDGAQQGAYAFYDRFSHQFNTATEADTVNEGWGFAAIVAVAGATQPAKNAWTAQLAELALPASATVGQPVTARVTGPAGVDLSTARVTWEAAGVEPWVGGRTFTFTPTAAGTVWVEADALLPDGRRVVATGQIDAQ